MRQSDIFENTAVPLQPSTPEKYQVV